MLPQVDPIGRVYTAPGGTPVSWNAGIGYSALGQVCTTLVAGPNDSWVGGWRLDPVGRVVVVVLAPPVYYNGGVPFNANGALDGQPNATPFAFDPYVRGMRVGELGVYGTTAVPPGFTFLDEMSVGHILTVGINPAGNRVGYRRGEWGAFLPDDVSSLERLFTNLNNNRLVVQASGDWSALNISNVHIERIVPPQTWDFGPPSNVVYTGGLTDFVWIVPGFDFVLGENYEVSLS